MNTINHYVLLDRSGSMGGSRWQESISSINSYARELPEGDVVSVFAFDSQFSSPLSFETIVDRASVTEWVDIDYNKLTPRGGTPLYDAVGELVRVVNSHNPERAVIIFITDGGENSSVELNRDGARRLSEQLRDKNYQVLFFGADFDSSADAVDMGYGADKALLMDKGGYVQTMRSTALNMADYRTRGAEISTLAIKAAATETI